MDNYYDEDWDFDGGLELDVSNHKKADKLKWIIVLIVGVLLVAAITVLAVHYAERQFLSRGRLLRVRVFLDADP